MKKFKRFKNTLKSYIGEILIIIGTALSSYNIFNFSYRTNTGACLPSRLCKGIYGVAYFYRDTSILLISAGFILIVAGILIVKNKK